MRVYLSGPMSGIPAFNIPAFDAAAARLRSLGYEVVSPAELDDPAFRDACVASNGSKESLEGELKLRGLKNESWGSLLARDVKLLADDGIEAVVVLPNWKTSRGALLETFTARLCEIPVFQYRAKERPALGPIEGLRMAHAWAYDRQGLAVVPKIEDVAPLPPIPVPEASSFSKTEIRVVDAETGGEKGEKPEAFDLLPWPALAEVAKVYAFGAKKYQPNNWRKGFRWGLCFASKVRHATAFWTGQSIDPETQCHHLASDVFHSLTLMEFERKRIGRDDRCLT